MTFHWRFTAECRGKQHEISIVSLSLVAVICSLFSRWYCDFVILRAPRLSAGKKSKAIFKPCFTAIVPRSIILHSKGLSVLPDHKIFYWKKCTKLRIWSKRIFEIFLWLLMTKKIRPLEYFWTQILNKHFKSKLSRRTLGFLWCEFNRTKFTRCELCLFWLFFKPPGAVTVFFFLFFFPVNKIYFWKKKTYHVFKTTMGYLWTEYAELICYHVPLIYDFAQSL